MLQASASRENSNTAPAPAAAAAAAAATSLPALKAELLTLAGSKNGVDLSEEDSKAVVEHLKQF